MTSGITSDRDERDDVPTAPEHIDLARQQRARWGRRAFVVALVAFLVGGLLQAYGPRSVAAEATGGGYHLRVEYASVTRPGLATPWAVEVRRPGGFDGSVTVAVTAGYFRTFDVNVVNPSPSAETTDGDRLLWEFDPPEGEVLRVQLDGRIEPGAQLVRNRARLAVVEDGRRVVEVAFTTQVLF